MSTRSGKSGLAWEARQLRDTGWISRPDGIAAPVSHIFTLLSSFRGLQDSLLDHVIVALSGFVGRYIYAQIPRSLGFRRCRSRTRKN